MGKLFEDIADSFAYFRSLRRRDDRILIINRSLRWRDGRTLIIKRALESGNYAVMNVLFDDDNSKEGDKK